MATLSDAGDGDEIEVLPEKVAAHYSRLENKTREEREASPIIHLKKLNNWVKGVLIRAYAKPGNTVLDVACGKGGDFAKFEKARVGHYVGIDIAAGSIEDARRRYNGEDVHDRRQLDRPFGFSARLIVGNAFKVSLEEELEPDAPFDLASCQFALHYAFSEERQVRRALRNVATKLRSGGHFVGTLPDANVLVQKLRAAPGLEFGNSVYNIRFDKRHSSKKFSKGEPFDCKYFFNLEDAVACPEYLVPFPVLKTLAEEYGLELVFATNFHTFIHQQMASPENEELMRRMGVLEGSPISADEWDAVYLYLAFVFRKAGTAPPNNQRRAHRGFRHIASEDIKTLEDDTL